MSVNSQSSIADLPCLPESVITRDGIIFDPRDICWATTSVGRRSTLCNFSIIKSMGPRFTMIIKFVLIDVLEKQSHGHFCNLWKSFLRFYRTSLYNDCKFDFISLAQILNFRMTLNPATDWKLGLVRVLILRANSLGYAMVTPDALDYLNDAVIPGNPKGKMFVCKTNVGERSRILNSTVLMPR